MVFELYTPYDANPIQSAISTQHSGVASRMPVHTYLRTEYIHAPPVHT